MTGNALREVAWSGRHLALAARTSDTTPRTSYRSKSSSVPPWHQPGAMLALALGALTACLAVWFTGQICALLLSGIWPPVPFSASLGLALHVVAKPSSPAAAWPASYRGLVPGPGIYYPVLAVVGALLAWIAVTGHRLLCQIRWYITAGTETSRSESWPGDKRSQRPRLSPLATRSRARGMSAGYGWKRWVRNRERMSARRHTQTRGARWARGRDLDSLKVRGGSRGRVVLGRYGRNLLAVESRHSVLVIGPTQTHKTSGFAIPAILEWQGPVVAVSVKGDLMRDTLRWRCTVGEVWIYDPGESLGSFADLAGSHSRGLPLPPETAGSESRSTFGSAAMTDTELLSSTVLEGGLGTRGTSPAHVGWSPLEASLTWPGARRMAARLATAAGRQDGAGVTDSSFWYATASKLLAALFFAAARSGRTMRDVLRWLDTREVGEVLDALIATGVPEAIQAAQASWNREERQLSSVYTTAETVLAAFADALASGGDCAGSRSVESRNINPRLLLDGGSRTLYVCSPAHEQRDLRPLFVALLEDVIHSALGTSNNRGTPLDPPLLIVLDEAAHVAPLPDLDELAATAASHGVQLVTVWQDISQLSARYGAKALTVVNNHRAKIYLSGISDPATLEHASQLIGDEEVSMTSTTMGDEGARSSTQHPGARRLLPGDALRRMPPGEGILLYGHLPPARIFLRPWFEDNQLRCRGEVLGASARLDLRSSREMRRRWLRRPTG